MLEEYATIGERKKDNAAQTSNSEPSTILSCQATPINQEYTYAAPSGRTVETTKERIDYKMIRKGVIEGEKSLNVVGSLKLFDNPIDTEQEVILRQPSLPSNIDITHSAKQGATQRVGIAPNYFELSVTQIPKIPLANKLDWISKEKPIKFKRKPGS